jgi:hypothetical protein
MTIFVKRRKGAFQQVPEKPPISDSWYGDQIRSSGCLFGSFDLIQNLAFNFFQLCRYRRIPFDIVDISLWEATLEISAYVDIGQLD